MVAFVVDSAAQLMGLLLKYPVSDPLLFLASPLTEQSESVACTRDRCVPPPERVSGGENLTEVAIEQMTEPWA